MIYYTPHECKPQSNLSHSLMSSAVTCVLFAGGGGGWGSEQGAPCSLTLGAPETGRHHSLHHPTPPHSRSADRNGRITDHISTACDPYLNYQVTSHQVPSHHPHQLSVHIRHTSVTYQTCFFTQELYVVR